jgi:hypothetical protein
MDRDTSVRRDMGRSGNMLADLPAAVTRVVVIPVDIDKLTDAG